MPSTRAGHTPRILHPTDFSSASRAAFARALAIASAEGRELVICHVVSAAMMPAVDGYVSPAVYQRILDGARDGARKQLDALVARAKRQGVRARAVLVEGTPFDRIVRVARAERADLVVMGTHGRTGLGRLFLGSVAERVVATSPVPVLTVRGR